jgi:hypothetical protein
MAALEQSIDEIADTSGPVSSLRMTWRREPARIERASSSTVLVQRSGAVLEQARALDACAAPAARNWDRSPAFRSRPATRFPAHATPPRRASQNPGARRRPRLRPPFDATSVERLRAAGADRRKTNMDEFADGPSNETAPWSGCIPPTRAAFRRPERW